MKLLMLIDVWNVVMWISLSAIGLLILFILLSKFAFIGQKNKKLLKSITIKYSYVRSLLLGEDIQYIRRIEAISDINLLMRPTYEAFFQRFETLRDNDDRRAALSIQILNEAIDEGNKEFKKIYNEHKAIILDYEKKVTALNKDLIAVIKPEAEIREESVYDKERLRIIKNTYHENRNDLDLVAPSFEKVFNQLELLFKEYESALNGAYYDEAKSYIEKIRLFNTQLEKALKILPLLCVKATILIPEKIDNLKNEYDAHMNAKIPLHHLRVNHEIETFNDILAEIRTQLIHFETRGVEHKLNLMSETIDELLTSFAIEKEKFETFSAQYDRTYFRVNDLEQQYIRLINRNPQIKEYYVINPSYEKKLEEANVYVNSMMGVKRSLDSFLHSATKQPYSVLVEKVHQLQIESEKVDNIIHDYQNYVESLRFIVEDGHAICKILFLKFKEFEVMLRTLNVDSYTNNFNSDFEVGYGMISQINILVRQKPINVTKVEIITNELRKIAHELEQRIFNDIKHAELAESAIVNLNAYRNQFSDLNTKLADEEQRFLNGQFVTTYENMMEQLRKYRNRK